MTRSCRVAPEIIYDFQSHSSEGKIPEQQFSLGYRSTADSESNIPSSCVRCSLICWCSDSAWEHSCGFTWMDFTVCISNPYLNTSTVYMIGEAFVVDSDIFVLMVVISVTIKCSSRLPQILIQVLWYIWNYTYFFGKCWSFMELYNTKNYKSLCFIYSLLLQ